MRKPLFTAEELAELEAYDREIEKQPLSMEELSLSRKRDMEAKYDRMDKKTRAIAERKREYYAANKDAIAKYQREYRAANKDAIAERKREYRAANKDAIAEYQREYYAANKDAIAERRREYRAANKDAIAEYQREYRKRKKKDVICHDGGLQSAGAKSRAAGD